MIQDTDTGAAGAHSAADSVVQRTVLTLTESRKCVYCVKGETFVNISRIRRHLLLAVVTLRCNHFWTVYSVSSGITAD